MIIVTQSNASNVYVYVYVQIKGYLGRSDIRKHCPFRDFIVWIDFCVLLTLIDRILGDREIAAVLVLH